MIFVKIEDIDNEKVNFEEGIYVFVEPKGIWELKKRLMDMLLAPTVPDKPPVWIKKN